uniref:Unk like zinc finger n=1 Tax=Lynx canadensis TaxID=61383 RepID=A0A667J6B0_LYNCA
SPGAPRTRSGRPPPGPRVTAGVSTGFRGGSARRRRRTSPFWAPARQRRPLVPCVGAPQGFSGGGGPALPSRGPAVDLHPGEVSLAPLDKELEEHDLGDLGPAGLNGVPGSIWDFVSGSFSPSPSPILNAGPAPASSASPSGAELARVRRQLDEAKRKIRQWEESWQQVKQACDAWQREAKEAKERALAADSARQLALQKKEEVEAQFRRLREELEGRGPGATLPGLPRCADLGATPLPKLHSLQTRLRLDLEAVDGVILQLRAKQCAVCRERARGGALQPCTCCEGPPLPW